MCSEATLVATQVQGREEACDMQRWVYFSWWWWWYVFGIFLYYRLECPASNGQAPLNDVHIINLSLVSDVQVKREVNTVPEAPQSLDLCRVSINN